MLEQLEESSEYPHLEPPQSSLTLSPLRVTPQRLQLHLLPPLEEEFGSLKLDNEEGEPRLSNPEDRDDRLEPTEDGGEMSRVLHLREYFSRSRARASAGERE